MMVRALRAWSPWSPADAVRWLTVGAIGHGLWISGWWLAHREAAFGDQIRWATLAVAGFIIAAYADVSWLVRARWALLERRERLLPSASASEPVDVRGDLLVAGTGRHHFHRPSCPLAVGKTFPPVTRSDTLAAGQRPCGVCQP